METGIFFRNLVLIAVAIALGIFLFLKDDIDQARVNLHVKSISEASILQSEQDLYLDLLMNSGESQLIEFAKKWKSTPSNLTLRESHDALKVYVQKNLPNAIIPNNSEVMDGER